MHFEKFSMLYKIYSMHYTYLCMSLTLSCFYICMYSWYFVFKCIFNHFEVHIDICDWICQMGLIHAEFQDILFIAICWLHQWTNSTYVCLILLKVEQSASTQASFSSLSDIYECLCGLQMAQSSLDRQIRSRL